MGKRVSHAYCEVDMMTVDTVGAGARSLAGNVMDKVVG